MSVLNRFFSKGALDVENPSSGITNVSIQKNGKEVVVRIRNASCNSSGVIGSLPSSVKPSLDTINSAGMGRKDSKFYPVLFSISTSGALTCSYFNPNTNTNDLSAMDYLYGSLTYFTS